MARKMSRVSSTICINIPTRFLSPLVQACYSIHYRCLFTCTPMSLDECTAHGSRIFSRFWPLLASNKACERPKKFVVLHWSEQMNMKKSSSRRTREGPSRKTTVILVLPCPSRTVGWWEMRITFRNADEQHKSVLSGLGGE